VFRSWLAGKPVETPEVQTFAEGVATRRPAALTLEIMRSHVHEFVLVSDDQMREAILLLLRTTHNLAEGAGAAALAAAFVMNTDLGTRLAGKTVVGVLSGGNLDLRELRKLLAESL
jgi:threonine dehydratase